MRERLPLVLSTTALVVAVLGTTPLGSAAVDAVLPRDSVGEAQLKDGAVTAAKVRDHSLLPRDFKPGVLPRGPVGPAGPPGTIEGVAAGGDLTGAYPSPELGPGVVTGAEIGDGALRLADTALLNGQVRVDPPLVTAHTCVSKSAPVPGVKPYDRTLVLPTQNLSPGLFVTQSFNTNAAGRVLFRICNATAKPLDAPLGGWSYVVWRA